MAVNFQRLLIGIFASLALAIAAAPAKADRPWLKGESKHFNVYGQVDSTQLKQFATNLENLDAVLRTLYGLRLDGPFGHKLDVYFVSDDDFEFAVPGSPKYGVGVYLPGERGTFALVKTSAPEYATSMITYHEYAHHFMFQHAGGYPAWYVEGFADYMSSNRFTSTTFLIGQNISARELQLWTKPWIPIADILSRDPQSFSDEDQLSFYAESWLLTNYIMNHPQLQASFGNYVNLCRKGIAPVKAWGQTMGAEVGQLESELHEYAKGGRKAFLFKRTWAEPAVAVTKLSEVEASILMDRLMLTAIPTKPDKARLFRSVDDAAKKFPKDRVVQLTRAEANLRYGDKRVAEQAFNALLADNPKDAAALVGLAELKLERSNGADGRAMQVDANNLLARALQSNPDDFVATMLYASNRTFEDGFPTDATMNAFVHSVNLAPEVGEARLRAGQAAILRREFPLAWDLLTPLTGNTHNPDQARKARALLAKLPPLESSPATPPAVAV